MMSAMPLAFDSLTPSNVTGLPSISMSPSSGGLHAAQDLHQRALAGAVLAHQREHLTGLSESETPCRATTPGKRLVMPRIRSRGVSL